MPRLLLLLLAYLLAPPAFAAADESETGDPWGHLRYFGFYASAMGSWNFTEGLAPHTNLTWIHVGDPADPVRAARRMVTRLREARDAGVSAVLSLEPFLFADAAGTPRSEEEIVGFLIELRARMEREGVEQTLAMIYPKDEPFREFKRYRNPDWYEEYITGKVFADIHRDLDRVNRTIRLVFPETPLGVILSGHHLDSHFLSIPGSYDWVGFDCYASLFQACGGRSFVQLYGRLLDHMQPGQRLIAVPETWVSWEQSERPGWAGVLLRRLRHHYEMALSDPRFVAFIPFIWSFDAEGVTPGLGLDRFPELYDGPADASGTRFLERVLAMGRQVRSSTQRYPNMAWSETEDHAARPPQRLRAALVSVSPQGWVAGWALDEALPHKNLRVRLVVRDARGRLLYKSRVSRTNRFVAPSDLPADLPRMVLGRHGFRLRIPKDLLVEHAGERLTIRVVARADGRDAEARVYDQGTFTARRGARF